MTPLYHSRVVMQNSESIEVSSKEIIATDDNSKYFRLNIKYFNNDSNEYYLLTSLLNYLPTIYLLTYFTLLTYLLT